MKKLITELEKWVKDLEADIEEKRKERKTALEAIEYLKNVAKICPKCGNHLVDVASWDLPMTPPKQICGKCGQMKW